MDLRVCKSCNKSLPLSDYYLKDSSTGRLDTKCKECRRLLINANYHDKRANSQWVEKERIRGREKYLRLYRGRKSKVDILFNYSHMSRKLQCRGIDTTGKEAHHWNYNKMDSVFLVSRSAHKIIHRYIYVNYDDGYCYTKDGVKIETAEQAKCIFSSILEQRGIKEPIELIEMGDFKEDVKRFSNHVSSLPFPPAQ